MSVSFAAAHTYLFGFRGDMSRAGPGAGMSIGNMSTHISIRPFEHTQENMQLNCGSLFPGSRPRLTLCYLLDARFVGVQQRSRLHVLRDELAAHPRDLLPVVQHRQSQMLLRLLLQALMQRDRDTTIESAKKVQFNKSV